MDGRDEAMVVSRDVKDRDCLGAVGLGKVRMWGNFTNIRDGLPMG